MQPIIIILDPEWQTTSVRKWLENSTFLEIIPYRSGGPILRNVTHHRSSWNPGKVLFWRLNFPNAEIEEITENHPILERIRLLNQVFHWPVEYIDQFIKQQGHLYQITLSSSERIRNLYYAHYTFNPLASVIALEQEA